QLHVRVLIVLSFGLRGRRLDRRSVEHVGAGLGFDRRFARAGSGVCCVRFGRRLLALARLHRRLKLRAALRGRHGGDLVVRPAVTLQALDFGLFDVPHLFPTAGGGLRLWFGRAGGFGWWLLRRWQSRRGRGFLLFLLAQEVVDVAAGLRPALEGVLFLWRAAG